MRILSILSLISLASASLAANSPHGKHKEEAQADLTVSCSDKYFTDSVNNGCDWYEANADLRCPYAIIFRDSNGDTAKDDCCACGGGYVGPDESGTWVFKSQTTGGFLECYSGAVGLYSTPEWAKLVVESFDGAYSMFFTDQKLYLSVDSAGKVGTSTTVGPAEKFKVVSYVGINGGGYWIQHDSTKLYLTVDPSALNSIVTSPSSTDYAGFDKESAPFDLGEDDKDAVDKVKK